MMGSLSYKTTTDMPTVRERFPEAGRPGLPPTEIVKQVRKIIEEGQLKKIK